MLDCRYLSSIRKISLVSFRGPCVLATLQRLCRQISSSCGNGSIHLLRVRSGACLFFRILDCAGRLALTSSFWQSSSWSWGPCETSILDLSFRRLRDRVAPNTPKPFTCFFWCIPYWRYFSSSSKLQSIWAGQQHSLASKVWCLDPCSPSWRSDSCFSSSDLEGLGRMSLDFL